MSDTAWIAITGVWSAIFTGLFGVVMWVLNRPKHEAEAKKAEVQVYGTMLATMERMSVVLEQKEIRLDKMEKRQDELEELVRQKDTHIAELETMIGELKEAMAAKDKQIADLNQLVVSLQAEGEKKDQRIGELQQEIVDLQQQRDDDRRRLDRLQQEKDRFGGEKDNTIEIPNTIMQKIFALAVPVNPTKTSSKPVEYDYPDSGHLAHTKNLRAYRPNPDQARPLIGFLVKPYQHPCPSEI